MEPLLKGSIMMFGFNFAPRGWLFCNGQLMSIAQNTALFSLLGTTYGGNGIQTFGLPDLRGRAPIGMGQGPGLSDYTQGEMSGAETVTLIQSEMPMHNHLVAASNGNGVSNPIGNFNGLADADGRGSFGYSTSTDGTMNPQMIGVAGGSQPHNNLSPYLVINYCIATEGIYPSRG